MSILHALPLPPVLVFELDVRYNHITHMTCITHCADFSLNAKLHILHALPPVYSLNVNITHITHVLQALPHLLNFSLK